MELKSYKFSALKFIQSLLVSFSVVFSLQTSANTDVHVIELLEKMSSAFMHADYDGVFVYSQGNDVKTLRIIHKIKDGIEKERLIHLDGERFELIRNGDQTYCVLSEEIDAKVEHRVPPSSFAQSFISDLTELKKNYHITKRSQYRFLGRDVVKIIISPKTEDRYSYHLWIDRVSGILLKSLLNDTNGKELERFQFSSLDIGMPVPDYLFMIEDRDRVKVIEIPSEKTANKKFKNGGWKVNEIPDGFTSIMTDQMDMTLPFMGSLQYMKAYTDGLFSFSVLIEKINPSSSGEGMSVMGATTVMSRRFSDMGDIYSITLVGEIPLAMVERVLASVVKLKPKQ